jgi:hypothetical protein
MLTLPGKSLATSGKIVGNYGYGHKECMAGTFYRHNQQAIPSTFGYFQSAITSKACGIAKA